MKTQTKRLYKSEKNKVITGLIGGIGEYFNIDPVIIRLVLVLAVIFTGIFPGVIAYLISSLIIPPKT